MQEESLWHGRLSQPIFLKHLNKTHQNILCETEIKIAYIKKHVYKERKETTHVEIGEENIHQHIYERIKYNVCHNKMVTRLVCKRLNETKKKEK